MARSASPYPPFLNPCLTEAELEDGAKASCGKSLAQPLNLLFVGRLETTKGAGICLDILSRLGKSGIAAHLDLIGEGPEREQFVTRARDLNLTSCVTFHGGLPRTSLGQFYAQAHFILLPTTCSEGWPKVLSEAMAYGVVPISTAISSIPQFLQNFGTGQTVPSPEPALFARVIQSYLESRGCWQEQSTNAVKAARQFTYNQYLNAVRQLLHVQVTAQA